MDKKQKLSTGQTSLKVDLVDSLVHFVVGAFDETSGRMPIVLGTFTSSNYHALR